MESQGVAILAYGPAARRAAARCVTSVREHCTVYSTVGDQAITVLSDSPLGIKGIDQRIGRELGPLHKLQVLDWTPYSRVLYLDADVRVRGDVRAGFGLLEAWDLAIAPSTNQANDWLWHASPEEREATLTTCGLQALQLQAGVWFLRRTEETLGFMKLWQEEWERYRGPDQGALLRALYRQPLRMWVLGRDWNGGDLVEHRFGEARGR